MDVVNGIASYYGSGALVLLGIVIVAIARALLSSRQRALHRRAMGILGVGLAALVGVQTWNNRHVRGWILTTDGDPIPGALVVLRDASGQRWTWRADERGAFAFSLPEGNPEQHRLLVCASTAQPLAVRSLPRNALGGVRLNLWPLQAPGGPSRELGRECDEVVASEGR